jgi:hypothetical protein
MSKKKTKFVTNPLSCVLEHPVFAVKAHEVAKVSVFARQEYFGSQGSAS